MDENRPKHQKKAIRRRQKAKKEKIFNMRINELFSKTKNDGEEPKNDNTEAAENIDKNNPKKRTNIFSRLNDFVGGKLDGPWYSIWIHKGIIIFVFICVLLYQFTVNYKNNEKSASTRLILNYEEASKGLNPNETRFNMYEIKSNDVMAKAIEYAGLQGYITPSELSKRISISAVYLKGVSATGSGPNYIATEYIINFSVDEELPNISAAEMLDVISKAYKDNFHESYTNNRTALKIDIEDIATLNELEYPEIGQLLKLKANQINRYVRQRAGENATYVSEETEESFKTLQKKTSNFLSIDIEKYNSFVLQSGLAKDRNEYVAQLQYEKECALEQYTLNKTRYEILIAAVKNYDSEMTSTVLIPTMDQNDQLYMARPKTGIDDISKSAESYNKYASSWLRTAEQLQLQMDILNSIKYNSTINENTAEQMINVMRNELKSLADVTIKTDQDYVTYTAKNYISFEPSTKGLVSSLEVKSSGLKASIAALLMCVYYFVKFRKK